MISQEAALRQADTVYRRLLAQGRARGRCPAGRGAVGHVEPRRRRQRWPTPDKRKQARIWDTSYRGESSTVYIHECERQSHSHFASAAAAVSEEMANLFRTMA